MRTGKTNDICYMLERGILDKLVTYWVDRCQLHDDTCTKPAVEEIGEMAYKYAIRCICDTMFVSPTNEGRALDIRAAAMLSPFVKYGLTYEALLSGTTLDCANVTVAIAPDYRLSFPLRQADLCSRLAAATIDSQIARLAQLKRWHELTVAQLHSVHAAVKRMRKSAKQNELFDAFKKETQIGVAAGEEQLHAMRKLESSRLFSHRLELLRDFGGLRKALDARVSSEALDRWNGFLEKIESYRVPV